MPISRLDTVYRSLVLSKFFNKGWGKPENLKKLFEFRKVVSKRETCFPLVDTEYPVTITKETNYSDSILLEGQFVSPFEHYLPGLLPQVSETAYFQVLLPKKWQSSHYKPVCLHLAGTGDHFFFRRRNLMAKPLLKEAGIGALLLENPFYGMRKPKDQRWSALHNVSDIFVMGGCLILESLVLFHWCKRNGLGPFGLTGISMGGHMASLAATNIPEPIVLVPCLSWTTASGVFTRGVMSAAINWELLEHQYFSDESYSKEIQHMVKIIDNVYIIADATATDEFYEKFILKRSSRSSFSISSASSKVSESFIQFMLSFVLPKYPDQMLWKAECLQDAAFQAGKHFAKNYPASLDHLKKISSNEMKKTDMNEKSKVIDSSSERKSEESSSKEKAYKGNLSGLEDAIGSKLEKAKSKMSDYLVWGTEKYWSGKESEGNGSDGKNSKIDKEKLAALQFMCGIMDECTHLKNFSVPVDTELIISVTAKDDAYVPRDGLTDLQELWQGSEIRYLNSGHVEAYLLHQKFFRLAIIDAFEKLKSKYFKDEMKIAQPNEEQQLKR